MKSRPKKIISLLLVTVFATTLLTGCFSKDGEANMDGPQVLRILGGWGEDNWLRQEWTDAYELTKGNVELEFTPLYEPYNPNQGEEEPEDPQERIKRLLTEGVPPDVILLDSNISTLTYLVEEGLVQPLETFIESSGYDVNALVPAIREGIKSAGDGTSMYALAPAFTSQALFFNKSLFDQYNVPYPTDNMTWTQVAELAKQFPKEEGEDQVYGLWNRYGNVSFYEFLYNFAAPLQLRVVDTEGENVVINTPEMESALTEYVNLYLDEVMSISPDTMTGEWTPEIQNYHEAFYRGKAAMALIDSWELGNLANRRMYDTEAGQFEWDVVTVPTHASAPGIGGQLNYRGLMAINRNSQNANLAWDFIQFNNSEKMLKIKSRNEGQFVSVAEMNQSQGDGPANLQAFFALTPPVDTLSAMHSTASERLWEIYSLADQQLQEVMNGDKTIKEALEEIQTKGQEILDSEPEAAPNTP